MELTDNDLTRIHGKEAIPTCSICQRALLSDEFVANTNRGCLSMWRASQMLLQPADSKVARLAGDCQA